jgi:hypothetical protein
LLGNPLERRVETHSSDWEFQLDTRRGSELIRGLRTDLVGQRQADRDREAPED